MLYFRYFQELFYLSTFLARYGNLLWLVNIFFFFELLTLFCVCHTFSLEPFVHQTRVQTITTKIYRVVQKVRILKQKLVFRLLINPNAVQATILYYKI